MSNGDPPVIVHDTDWLTFDGVNVGVLTGDDVNANYTIGTPPTVAGKS